MSTKANLGLCRKKGKNHSTQDSRVVPHRGTNWAALWLTAQIRRDAVLSESYGRGCLTIHIMSIETNCSLLINKYKKRKSTLDPVQKKLGQLNSLTAATNPFSDIQRKVNQPPHIAPTLASCSARHKNGGPTDVHCPQGFSKVIWEYKAFGTRGSTPHGRALEWKLQILSLLITLKTK